MKSHNSALSFIITFSLIILSCTNTQQTVSQVTSSDSATSPTTTVANAEKAEDTTKYVSNDYFEYDNKIYDDNIHTAQLNPVGAPMGLPVIQLNAGQLQLQFDDFVPDVEQYKYKVIFCNHDWKPADIPELEYMGGFTFGFIDNYSYSANTYQPYIHYRVTLPNSSLQLKLPGNYLLVVYLDDPKKPILTKRFYVYQKRVSIQPNIHQSSIVQKMDYDQEVDFNVSLGNLNIRDPYSDIMPVLRQNFRNDNEITGLKPVFVKANKLVYDLNGPNDFAGGNEFRGIDLTNEKYLSAGIQRITLQQEPRRYHFYLYPDEVTAYKSYLSEQDIDGNYLVKNQNGSNPAIDADYFFVTFSLKYPSPETNGNMYIIGAFNDWQFNDKNKMVYDYKKQEYTITLYLKQGYYDYAYAFLPDKSQKATFIYTEGDHFDTENSYQILIYAREMNKDYDELVGFKNVKFH